MVLLQSDFQFMFQVYIERLYKHEKINHIIRQYSFSKYKKKCNPLAIVRNILGGIRKMILYRVEKKNTDFWIHVTFLSIFSLEASNIYHFLLMVHRIVQNKCRQVQRFLKTLPYSLLTVIFSFTHTYINQGYQFHFQIILFLSEIYYLVLD